MNIERVNSTPKALALIVACSQNSVIGQKGALPWDYPEDLRYFRKVTIGHSLIMGRHTFESIWQKTGRVLPGRQMIVLSSGPTYSAKDLCFVSSCDEALKVAYARDNMPFVIGGRNVYSAFLTSVTHFFLTLIKRDVEGDVVFPVWPLEPYLRDFDLFSKDENSHSELSFMSYVRRDFKG